MGARPEGKTLDRINTDGNYEPSNCRWATLSEQQRNRRDTRMATLLGQTKSIKEWADIAGVDTKTIIMRIKRGWPDDLIVSMSGDKSNSVARNRPDVIERNKRNATHGMTETDTYKSWRSMKERCYLSSSKDYKDHGAKGITVSEEWMDFSAFYRDMGERPAGMTLGRIDKSKSYCKENCKWQTTSERTNNTSVSRYIEYNGERKTIAQWARELGKSRQSIRYRLEAGWSIEDILSPIFDKSIKRKPSHVNA
jgi:hypothetical protein